MSRVVKSYIDFGDDDHIVGEAWNKDSVIAEILLEANYEVPKWVVFKDINFGYDLICIKNKHVSEEIVVGSNPWSERQSKVAGRMYQIVMGVYITQEEGVSNSTMPWKSLVADSAERLYKKLDMEV